MFPECQKKVNRKLQPAQVRLHKYSWDLNITNDFRRKRTSHTTNFNNFSATFHCNVGLTFLFFVFHQVLLTTLDGWHSSPWDKCWGTGAAWSQWLPLCHRRPLPSTSSQWTRCRTWEKGDFTNKAVLLHVWRIEVVLRGGYAALTSKIEDSVEQRTTGGGGE